MPAKKNTKTLYSKTNPVDISSLLTNLNLGTNASQMIAQTGGKRTTDKSTHKNKKTKKMTDDDDFDSDEDLESDDDSQIGKGKDEDDNDDEEEEDNEEEEPEPEPEVEADAEDLDEVADENEDEDNEEDEKSVHSDKEKDDDDDDDKETLDTSNKCYSKYAKEDDFDLDEYFKDDDIIITKTGRVGKPILFKYEKVRLLSDRSRQLAEGAKPMIKNTAGLGHKDIALLELKNKLIPLIIERPIPNAGSERWRLSELEIPEYD
jgi:DNA-directed RNA polymerase subunit K/omega